MPVLHLPSLGVFLPTLLTQHPCMSFPRSRTTDYHSLGSRVPKEQARTGPGAPTGCTKLDAGAGQPHTLPRRLWLAAAPGLASHEQAALRQKPGLAAGREMGVCKMKYQGYPCPCFTLCFPLTLCYHSYRLPQRFSGSIKLSACLPPSQLVILKIALFEDKVRRRHWPTSMESSSKVHGQAFRPVGHRCASWEQNTEPLSVPGLFRAVAPPGRRSTSDIW